MEVDKGCNLLARCVARTFRTFPRSHREEFEGEMRAVFFLAAEEAGRKGKFNLLVWMAREQWYILTEASREHWRLARGRGYLQMNTPGADDEVAEERQDSLPADSRSWQTLLAGSLLFLIWGLQSVSWEAAYSVSGWGQAVGLAANKISSWLIFLLPAVIVGYAWTRNFPRWTYAYAGSALLYTYFMAANLIATPQTSLLNISAEVNQTWGWRAWVPLLLALGVGMAITRSLRPLRRFFANAWQDWTVLSYALFGWIPLLLFASFDETPSTLKLTCLPLTTGILTVAAVLYLASRRSSGRAGALFGGAYLSLGLTLIVTEIYWSGIGAVNSGRILWIMIVFLGILFSPALIGIAKHFQQRGVLGQS